MNDRHDHRDAQIDEQAILRKIARSPKQTAGFKQLVRELRAHGNDRRRLGEELVRLVRQRKLVQIAKDRFAIPQAAEKKNLVSGRLSMHRDGYGFVTPDSPELKSKLAGDIFINPQAVGAAMHGDEVLVEITHTRAGGRAEGRIVRVAGRAHGTVVGVFHHGRRENYVAPIDEKITQEIVIPPGAEWPRNTAEDAEDAGKEEKNKKERHRVIGGEAKRREVTRDGDWQDLEGVVVDVEITQWPSPTQNPRGRVIEILGYEDDFGVDTEIIIRKYHIPHRFPAGALAEAESLEGIISGRELRHRRDYRTLPIVTIDGETARDFDDAVYVRRLPHGDFELQVHIADVAHYVREGSPVDDEARTRGTSVYFPDRAVPMLPMELSTDLCSLRPHLERRVLACTMQIDARGEILGYELNEGVIRSAERMTYTAVNAALEGEPETCRRYAALVAEFGLMRELAMILNRKRERRGSIDFDLPEPVIEFDEQGLMQGIARSERNIAHRIIEEFMLAANECVANYLEQRNIASLYRVHEKPDPKRIYEFEQIAVAFGYSLGVGVLPVRRVHLHADRRSHQRQQGHGRRNPEPIELPEDVHITPHMYQKLTKKIAGKPEERILSFLMLRSLKQARYSEQNLGHFALAAPTYTHFTSPIRRYPDLIVHRILKDVLREQAEQYDGEVPVGSGGALPSGGIERKLAEQMKPGTLNRPPHARPHQRREEPKREPGGPMDEEELHQIAEQSSQTERRADDAERELLEWKKIKFMQDRIGEEFDGLIVSVTKFGLFVELTDLFIEGLAPISTLPGDRYTYRENTRQIIGERSKRTFSLGDRVRVLVDRIDRMQRKIQFAIVEEVRQKEKGKRRR